MKNNNFRKRETNEKNKGFYIALASCVGILLASGGVISYTNLNKIRKGEMKPLEASNEEIAAEVALNNAKSYIDPDEIADSGTQQSQELQESTILKNDDTSQDKLKENSQEDQNKEITQNFESKPTQEIEEDLNNKKPKNDQNLSKDEKEQKNQEDQKTTSLENTQDEETSPVFNNSTQTTVNAQDMETTTYYVENVDASSNKDLEVKNDKQIEGFAETQKMMWPLMGEIVMDFSPNHVVWDETLQLYKTNDSIRLSAQVGTQVKAATDGIVKQIYTDNNYGNVVVIDHGNGWLTTYGQLQNNILVQEGDVVSAGQVIGGVSKASRISSLSGSHLDLKITKNDEAIDPKVMLAQ